MEPVSVSIIVPIYNVEKYLKRCLDSLLDQDFKDSYEIILVNDGSPDHSIDICNHYVSCHDNIKLINKENAGLGFARNTGLENAVGKYVVFVDSDDFVTRDMLSYLYGTATRENADIVYAGHIKYYSEKNIINDNTGNPDEAVISSDKINDFRLDMIASSAEMKSDTPIEVSVWAAMFKMSTIVDNNIRFVSERQYISEDVIFNTDLYRFANKIVLSSKKIYYYCFNPESLSKCYNKNRFEKDVELYYYLKDKLSGDYDEKELNQRLYRFLIARVRCAMCSIVSSEKRFGKTECISLIKNICDNAEVRKACEEFSYNKLTQLQKTFFICLKKKRINNLYILCKLNNLRKQ